MATTYGTRWTITFKDIDQNTHTINIQQAGWEGDVTELIPGKNPIKIDEDNSENLNKRVRGITGRIEVIEENYGDLSDLFPQYSTQMRVVCNNVFFGYIKAQNSSNAWESGPRSIKLNILSPLELAYDIPMPVNTTMGLREVGSVMSDVLTTLGYDHLIMPVGTSSDKADFLRGSIRGMLICPYADDRSYHYQNDNQVFAPMSCGDVLEAFCTRHDLICHEVAALQNGQPIAQLVLQRMTTPGKYYRWTTDDITNGNYDTAILYNAGSVKHAMLSDFTVSDNNNTEQLVKPYSVIDVEHSGAVGEEQVPLPTKHCYYGGTDIYNRLIPRGIWITNIDQRVMYRGEWMAKPGTEGSDRDDYEIVEELDVNPSSPFNDNTLLFTIAFYNVDPSLIYRLKMSYSRSGNSSYFRISARGKGGWFYPGTGQDNHPIASSEQKEIMSLSGGGQYERSFEGYANFYMIPDEYIIVNVYAGAGLEDVKIWDIQLEGRQVQSTGISDKYNEQTFFARFIGNAGNKSLTIKQQMNSTFFSNYYSTQLAYSMYEYTFMLESQRRIRITVKGDAMTFLWYLYQYYINDQNEIWKLVAVSRNVRDNTYTLTFHHSSSF